MGQSLPKVIDPIDVASPHDVVIDSPHVRARVRVLYQSECRHIICCSTREISDVGFRISDEFCAPQRSQMRRNLKSEILFIPPQPDRMKERADFHHSKSAAARLAARPCSGWRKLSPTDSPPPTPQSAYSLRKRGVP